MSEVDSPFRSPTCDSNLELDEERQAIYLVGIYRQWVGWSFLGCLVTQFLVVAAASLWNDLYNGWYVSRWIWNSYQVIYLAATVLQVTFLVLSLFACFALTQSLLNRLMAFLVLPLMFVPGLCLLILLVLNELGNYHLRKLGINVGVFGASARNIRDQLQSQSEAPSD